MKKNKGFGHFVSVILIFSVALGSFSVSALAYEKNNINFEQFKTKTLFSNNEDTFNKTNSLINKKQTSGLEKSQLQESKKDYVEGEILVKYKNNKINLQTASGKAVALNFSRSKSLEKKEDIVKNNISVLRIKDAKTVEQKIAELKNDPSVEYAQPNFQYYPQTISSNDTYKDSLWGLDNTSQTVNAVAGTNDADIDTLKAWTINEGTNAS